MSYQYDAYLQQHKANVKKGYDWLCEKLPHIIGVTHIDIDIESQICVNHDLSKTSKEEYDAYDAYFYGGNRSYQVVQNFRKAWLSHIHNNPHHWQHWVLHNDDPGEGMVILDMPYNYIIEMICDWWAFSWTKENLYEIFSWYDDHKNYMKLSDKTRKTVESILAQIKTALDNENGN